MQSKLLDSPGQERNIRVMMYRLNLDVGEWWERWESGLGGVPA
jgi:hypothetical protein